MKNSILSALLIVGFLTFGTSADAAPKTAPKKPAPSMWKARFIFGSYGRVSFASNLRGGQGRPAHVVRYGPRLIEKPYLELDFSYVQYINSTDKGVRTTVTIAFNEDLFHYNGEFDAKIALRNLYLESFGLLADRLRIWVGSRMYRGDDVYLFDFWPLDELNTVGAGVMYDFSIPLKLKFHVGTNRLKDKFQVQEIEVVKEPIGSKTIVFMDRQRWIGSLKLTWEPKFKQNQFGYKASLYTEFHFLPSGTFRSESRADESLPRDFGWSIGTQFGIWGYGKKGSFTNLFIRYSGGLAAFGDLAIPFGLDTKKKTTSARELMIALSTNWESKWVGLMAGVWFRYFKDADVNRVDNDDGWEGAFSIRPHIYIHKYFQQVFEVSYQFSYPFGLDPNTGGRRFPQIWQIGIMPTFSIGRGTYTRPQIRLIYAVSILNRSARNLYAEDDNRRGQRLQHYIGAGVEWWFNSSYR